MLYHNHANGTAIIHLHQCLCTLLPGVSSCSSSIVSDQVVSTLQKKKRHYIISGQIPKKRNHAKQRSLTLSPRYPFHGYIYILGGWLDTSNILVNRRILTQLTGCLLSPAAVSIIVRSDTSRTQDVRFAIARLNLAHHSMHCSST